jgi:hypothetical protein
LWQHDVLGTALHKSLSSLKCSGCCKVNWRPVHDSRGESSVDIMHDIQVAVVIGAHRSSVCPCCTHEEIAEPMYAPLWSAAALCGHRSRAAMICITDMRTPQIVDRCNLPSVSVMSQVVACPGREHYVFTRFVSLNHF